MKSIRIACLIGAAALPAPIAAYATPSTTFWAPSTASCQGFGVPHVTYDTYFWKGPPVGRLGRNGLSRRHRPHRRISAVQEVARRSGIRSVVAQPGSVLSECEGLRSRSGALQGFARHQLRHLQRGDERRRDQLQRAPFDGPERAAVRRLRLRRVLSSTNDVLFTNSDGKVVKTGGMFAAASPDIQIGLKGLKKMNVIADVQTGKNVLGAWGSGPTVYFADNVSLILGPVFFFDKNLQPGGSHYMWTTQLDIDFPLGR